MRKTFATWVMSSEQMEDEMRLPSIGVFDAVEVKKTSFVIRVHVHPDWPDARRIAVRETVGRFTQHLWKHGAYAVQAEETRAPVEKVPASA